MKKLYPLLILLLVPFAYAVEDKQPSTMDNILYYLVYMISGIAAATIATMIVLFVYKLFKRNK